MKTEDLDYALAADQIAQAPAAQRDASRLLVLDRARDHHLEHARFHDLARYLRAGDLLVLNDARVLPARLVGTKPSGGRIEILLVEPESAGRSVDEIHGQHRNDRCDGLEGAAGNHWVQGVQGVQECADTEDDDASTDAGIPMPRGPHTVPGAAQIWSCLAGFSRAPQRGAMLDLGGGLRAEYLGGSPGEKAEMHRIKLLPKSGTSVREAIYASGQVPLPPYIERISAGGPSDEDADRYQTVYASREGAIAAPTAGLHFTPELLSALRASGIETSAVTLHVGPATFLPVRTEHIEDHPIGAERYEVPRSTARAVARTREHGGRVIAVGTTVVRALESASDGRRGVVPARGRTDLFILPGFRFRVVDALVTNFHLPRSTLLALVCAFAGRDRILEAYREAAATGYRFYSFGDATLIL